MRWTEQRNWRQPPAHSILFFLSTSALPNELNEEKRRIDGHWGPREQSSHQSSTKKNKIILFLFDWWNWCAAVPAEESGRIELPFFFFGCGLWAQSAIGNKPKEKTSRSSFRQQSQKAINQSQRENKEKAPRSLVCLLVGYGRWPSCSAPTHPNWFITHSSIVVVVLARSARRRLAHALQQPQKRGHPTLTLLLVCEWRAKNIITLFDEWNK